MLISNFTIGRGPELGTRDTAYCLQVTNLEAIDIEFLFECFVTPSSTSGLRDDPETHPVTNGATGFGAAYLEATQMWSTPGPLRFSLHGNTGRGQTHVWVPAGASRRVRIWGERRLSGYVSLRVPAGRTPGRFALAPQLRGSVRVLLHASHETYRPSRRQPLIHSDGVTEDLSYTIGDDKSSASVALASGRAENEIEAEGWSVGGISDFLNALSDGVLYDR